MTDFVFRFTCKTTKIAQYSECCILMESLLEVVQVKTGSCFYSAFF